MRSASIFCGGLRVNLRGRFRSGANARDVGGKILMLKGYGFESIETKTPASENTVFEIASLTKQFTVASVLLLVEDGKVMLDEQVGKRLPELPEKWRAVTVRQLLNKTSGIKNYTAVAPALDAEKEYKRAEIIRRVADAPLEFARARIGLTAIPIISSSVC